MAKKKKVKTTKKKVSKKREQEMKDFNALGSMKWASLSFGRYS
jgi:hypothetical protein